MRDGEIRNAPLPSPSPLPSPDPGGEAPRIGSPEANALRDTLANALWLEQEELRKKLRTQGIACRGVSATPGAQAAVIRILNEGYTDSDCRLVLAEFYREALEKRDARWFDGVTNWKSDSFRRALSNAAPAPSGPVVATDSAGAAALLDRMRAANGGTLCEP